MSLQEEIRKVFANVSRPSDDALFLYDSEGADAVLYARRWDEVPAADLNYHSVALLAFTPSAFVYFLPAFMIAALNNKGWGLKDNVLYSVSPPKGNPKRPSYQQWWSLLSTEQRLCVIAFIEEFSPENPEHYGPISAALREYV